MKLAAPSLNLDSAIERLYDLRPGITPVQEGSPHERPHKSLLLLAALDPRRSNGEAELLAIAGKTLLLPQDQAFHPNADGLQWRFSQLVA